MADTLPIAELTDTAAVLASAGLSSRGDVRPETVIESGIEADLLLTLGTKVPTYEKIISEGNLADADNQQKLRLLALKNYAKWFCAALMCSRWLMLKQLASDGKTRADRFDRMDLNQMQANAERQRGVALGMLYKTLPTADVPARTMPTLLGVSTPATDPVTDIDAGA